MFERLLDLIIGLKDSLSPVFIVDQTEMGIVKRLGLFKRVVEPGLRWKWPVLEAEETETVVVTTLNLTAQTLTTFDDKSIVISAIVTYSISDIKKYLLNMYDCEEVLADITMGEIQSKVSEINYVDLFEVEKTVLPMVRKKLKDYGIRVKMVTFIDLGAVRSIRLIQDS
jgi:regulator of protease activity HflC (stomatin/prohibitin superfamily)